MFFTLQHIESIPKWVTLQKYLVYVTVINLKYRLSHVENFFDLFLCAELGAVMAGKKYSSSPRSLTECLKNCEKEFRTFSRARKVLFNNCTLGEGCVRPGALHLKDTDFRAVLEALLNNTWKGYSRIASRIKSEAVLLTLRKLKFKKNFTVIDLTNRLLCGLKQCYTDSEVFFSRDHVKRFRAKRAEERDKRTCRQSEETAKEIHERIISWRTDGVRIDFFGQKVYFSDSKRFIEAEECMMFMCSIYLDEIKKSKVPSEVYTFLDTKEIGSENNSNQKLEGEPISEEQGEIKYKSFRGLQEEKARAFSRYWKTVFWAKKILSKVSVDCSGGSAERGCVCIRRFFLDKTITQRKLREQPNSGVKVDESILKGEKNESVLNALENLKKEDVTINDLKTILFPEIQNFFQIPSEQDQLEIKKNKPSAGVSCFLQDVLTKTHDDCGSTIFGSTQNSLNQGVNVQITSSNVPKPWKKFYDQSVLEMQETTSVEVEKYFYAEKHQQYCCT